MLITGASRGIGAATATAAAAKGWSVIATFAADSSAVATESLCAGLQAGGVSAVARQVDVAQEAEVLALFDWADREVGQIDCLVNNAGIGPGYGPFEQLTVEVLEQTWAVNLTGAFVCAREAVKRMATDHGGTGGSIVNIGSKAAAIGGPNEWIHYAASKGAIDTLTLGLSKEFAARGVRVNCVRPGLIEGGFGPWAPENRVANMTSAIPMQRSADPSEIASAIVWLASPEASYVTGAIVDVTGGR
jgi:NAD(P)-dependent dehydrogenase (short-subunit alcohol dehydrogenase family)